MPGSRAKMPAPHSPAPNGPTAWTPPALGIAPGVGNELFRSKTDALAAELGLPLATEDRYRFDFLLVVGKAGLELHETRPHASGPLRVDFTGLTGPAGRRHRVDPRQPLALAVGLKRRRPRVVDATAGLGRDTLLLALLGCTVTAVERIPVLGVMLREALDRRAEDPRLGPILRERVRLIIGDARGVLTRMSAGEAPDVVYLDPMYPPKKKSALPKKEMRLLRRLVGDDPDAGGLLEVALRVARDRVVVKRPLHAPPLSPTSPSSAIVPLSPTPILTYKGKMARYDVYLTRGAVLSAEC